MATYIMLLCLLTPVTLAGAHFPDTSDCYVVRKNVALYTGTQSRDKNGIACLDWWRLGDRVVFHNYCRDYLGVGIPYCFTRVGLRSSCNVPNCTFLHHDPRGNWSHGSLSNLTMKTPEENNLFSDDWKQFVHPGRDQVRKTPGGGRSVEATASSWDSSFLSVPSSEEDQTSQYDSATGGAAPTAGMTSQNAEETWQTTEELAPKKEEGRKVPEGEKQTDYKASIYLTWIIGGAIVGLVLAVALAAAFILFFCNYRKTERSTSEPPFPVLSIETIAADVGRSGVMSYYTPMPRSPTARR